MPNIGCRFVLLHAVCLCLSRARRARESQAAIFREMDIQDEEGAKFRYTCQYKCRYELRHGADVPAIMSLSYYDVRNGKKNEGKCMDPRVGCKLPKQDEKVDVEVYQGLCNSLLSDSQDKCESLGENPDRANVSTIAHVPSEWRGTAKVDIRAHAYGGPPTSRTPPGLRISEGKGKVFGFFGSKSYDIYADEEALAQVCLSDQLLLKRLALQKLRALAAGERGGQWDELTKDPDITQDRFDIVKALRLSSASNPARHYTFIQDQITKWEDQDTQEVVRSFQAKHPSLFEM